MNTIDGRARDIGGFRVRRFLPSRACPSVGPFVFFDHAGPTDLAPGHGLDVPPHPHIGLATVTYLFEGAIVHRDSLGSHQAIRTGDINWMTAGRGHRAFGTYGRGFASHRFALERVADLGGASNG